MHLLTTLFAAALATPVAAQAMHLVGPGGFPEIRSAIAIAGAGDTIAVQPGTYAHFEVTQSLTIRAVTPGTVDVRYDPAYLPSPCNLNCFSAEGATRFHLQAGEFAHVIGLRFVGNVSFQALPIYHTVAVTGGAVSFDDCTIESADSYVLFVVDCNLHVQSTTVTGLLGGPTGPTAMRAHDSFITAIDSTFQGGGQSFSGGLGIDLFDSTLHGSRLTLVGATWAAALYSFTPAEVWLSDSTMSTGFGACPVSLWSPTGRFSRCTLSAATSTCSQPASGFLLGVSRPLPPAAGAPFQVDFTTQPNGLVGLIGSFELTPQIVAPIEQPWLAPLATSIPLGVVAANGSGLAVASIPIPATLPTLSLPVWIHGVAGTALPLQSSPPVGGVVR